MRHHPQTPCLSTVCSSLPTPAASGPAHELRELAAPLHGREVLARPGEFTVELRPGTTGEDRYTIVIHNTGTEPLAKLTLAEIRHPPGEASVSSVFATDLPRIPPGQRRTLRGPRSRSAGEKILATVMAHQGGHGCVYRSAELEIAPPPD